MSDYLSNCPSLVDVLSLLHHEDILHLKLLSRRFYNVIEHNGLRMPRNHIINLTIKNDAEITGGKREFVVSALIQGYDEFRRGTRNNFYLTDSVTHIWICENAALREHYKRNDFGKRVCTADSVTNSVEERLQFLLSYLFRHYHIRQLVLCDSSAQFFSGLIKQTLLKFNTNCEHSAVRMRRTLKTPDSLDQLCFKCSFDDHEDRDLEISLPRIRWCQHKYKDSQNLIFSACQHKYKDSQYDTFSAWHTNKTLQPIVDLTTKWQLGGFRLKTLIIRSFGDPSHQELLATFANQSISTEYHRTGEVQTSEGTYVEVFFSRSSDDVILRLAYCQSSRSLAIDDAACRQERAFPLPLPYRFIIN